MDATVRIVTVTRAGRAASSGAIVAEARLFVARGAPEGVLGSEADGLVWTLERCDELGCAPAQEILHISRATTARVFFRPRRRGLYLLRVSTTLGLAGEATYRRGAVP